MEGLRVSCDFVLPSIVLLSWFAPEMDFIMINDDGSMRLLTGGWGAVLRVSSGEVVVVAKGGGPSIFVNVHELQGVELGFNLAIVRGFKKVHLAIDSMFIYFLLTKDDFSPPWNLIQIWRRVKRMRSSFEVLKVSHVYRETNRAADHLTSYHPPIKWVDVGIEDFSPECFEIIKEDSEGKLFVFLLLQFFYFSVSWGGIPLNPAV